MTVREAAKRLEVSEDTVYALCRARKLAHQRIGARGKGTIRITPEAVAAYLASVSIEAKADQPTTHRPAVKPAARSDWQERLRARREAR